METRSTVIDLGRNVLRVERHTYRMSWGSQNIYTATLNGKLILDAGTLADVQRAVQPHVGLGLSLRAMDEMLQRIPPVHCDDLFADTSHSWIN